MSYYRTRTYIAADWTGDSDAVERLQQWNNSDHWSLSFPDAHDLTQSYDTSLPCTIKKSLQERLNASKTFVLIVGEKTKLLTKGKCCFCSSYNSWTGSCARCHPIDNRSYITYECEKALEAGMKIIVLYNFATVYRDKCPDVLKYKGIHIPMCYFENGKYYWDYEAVKKALM